MLIKEITTLLESWAPLALAADYDNPGLQTGHPSWEVSGILLTLDCTETVVDEAIANKANLIICHHPVIFKKLKSLTGNNYVERTIIKAIKNDVAIYAIHTNLDAKLDGVNNIIARKLGLLKESITILRPESQTLQALTVFVPLESKEAVKAAIHTAGAGTIGNYSHCSYELEGQGQFMPLDGAKPFIGKENQLEKVAEARIECILPKTITLAVIAAMKAAHPYEEPAYFIHPLANLSAEIGYGIVGNLPQEMSEMDFLHHIKSSLNVSVIRHTALLNKPVRRVALSGGTCSFLIPDAIKSKADVFITSDVKYHEFFDADNQILLADINHHESEQFTPELIFEYLRGKIGYIAVFFSKAVINPIQYL